MSQVLKDVQELVKQREQKGIPMRRNKLHCVCEKNDHSWKWRVCRTQGLMPFNPFNNLQWQGTSQQMLAAVLENRVLEPLSVSGPAPLAAGLPGGLGSCGWMVGGCWTGEHRGLGEVVFTHWFRGYIKVCQLNVCPKWREEGRKRTLRRGQGLQGPLDNDGPSPWAEMPFAQTPLFVVCLYVDLPIKIPSGGSILM